MRRHRLFLALASVMVLAVSGVGGVLADHENHEHLKHIHVIVPQDDIASCADTVTYENISITGVGQNPDVWLIGQIFMEYTTAAGLVPVPGGYHVINQSEDLYLQLAYPPVSEWPFRIDPHTGKPVGEIHVTIQVQVYYKGMKIGDAIGPGHDWDVFCLTPPPSPPPPPGEPGTEGCTPGYWKNHLTAWTATAFTPDQKFGAIFGVNATGDPTLLQAVNTGGGGEEALFRHATAAILNASISGVDYNFTVEQVKKIVQDAYASGDFETAKNKLEVENERGCFLEGYANTTAGGPSVGAKIENKKK